MSAVRCEALCKRYGAVAALDSVSFALAPGALALIAGPNGAGKSTLLRVLAMLTRPSSGAVQVLDADPFASAGSGLRGRVGYLGSEAGLYAELSIEENLRFAAQLLGLEAERISATIEELGLKAVRGQRVRTLSLGFRRRAGLARALLCAPELLLLDEPWNGLDAAAAKQLAGLLARRRETGATTLVAAHAVGEQRDLFDTRLSMEAGRLSMESAS